MDQSTIKPIQLHVAGNPETGEVWLHYRTEPDATTSIQLTPEMLRDTIANLVLCASQSTQRDVIEAVQVIATRELHARVLPGPLLVLDQELECGLKMSMTFDESDARRLSDELEDALAALPPGNGAQH